MQDEKPLRSPVMNTQLVDSLVQIIESLTKDERSLLEKRLQAKPNWEAIEQQLDQLQVQIRADRGGTSLNCSGCQRW